MPVKYIPYYPNTVQGQAILDNITRTQRVLRYRENDKVYDRIKRGMPYYEVEPMETVGKPSENLVIRGECISACAYLKEKRIKVDLVYIDPPFASGADYAKKVQIRRNPKLAAEVKEKELTAMERIKYLKQMEEETGHSFGEEIKNEEIKLQEFEEKMYGDIWNKESYINWLYENLMAVKSIMSENASIYLHLGSHVGHYGKILMDEVFGEDNFRNDIIWRRSDAHNDKTLTSYGNIHDMIFFYSINSENYIWNRVTTEIEQETIDRDYKEEEGTGRLYRLGDLEGPGGRGSIYSINGITKSWKWKYETFKAVDDKGGIYYTKGGRPFYKIYLDEHSGVPLQTLWLDCPQIKGGDENVNYATQKPEALIDRILRNSSNEGFMIADFFGGSGVTAKVASNLARKFIHVDIGINSIQTTRDRLLQSNVNFQILEIKDGVSLFRNPQQTMDKLTTLIPGLQKGVKSISSFWFGAITKSKEGIVPVYVPNLLNTQEKVLDIPTINTIINQELQNLGVKAKKVIVYYIDIDDQKALEKFIKDNNATEIEVELKDLKNLLHDVVFEDIIDFKTTKTKAGYETVINKFISDRLIQKIGEFNQKGNLQSIAKGKKFNPITISEEGLELIELVTLDCNNSKGQWHSTTEIKIDKFGYVIKDGVKSKDFWDGKIISKKKPKRIKIRNISGDETIKSM